jgi:hypothetical protein
LPSLGSVHSIVLPHVDVWELACESSSFGGTQKRCLESQFLLSRFYAPWTPVLFPVLRGMEPLSMAQSPRPTGLTVINTEQCVSHLIALSYIAQSTEPTHNKQLQYLCRSAPDSPLILTRSINPGRPSKVLNWSSTQSTWSVHSPLTEIPVRTCETNTIQQVHADASTFVEGVTKEEAYQQVLDQAEGLFFEQRNWVCLANVNP